MWAHGVCDTEPWTWDDFRNGHSRRVWRDIRAERLADCRRGGVSVGSHLRGRGCGYGGTAFAIWLESDPLGGGPGGSCLGQVLKHVREEALEDMHQGIDGETGCGPETRTVRRSVHGVVLDGTGGFQRSTEPTRQYPQRRSQRSWMGRSGCWCILGELLRGSLLICDPLVVGMLGLGKPTRSLVALFRGSTQPGLGVRKSGP